MGAVTLHLPTVSFEPESRSVYNRLVKTNKWSGLWLDSDGAALIRGLKRVSRFFIYALSVNEKPSLTSVKRILPSVRIHLVNNYTKYVRTLTNILNKKYIFFKKHVGLAHLQIHSWIQTDLDYPYRSLIMPKIFF